MSSFTAPLMLEPDGATWRTSQAFAYEIGRKGSGLLIEVPAGTPTDLGTIPRLLWPLLPPHDPRCAAAFVLHDRLCADAAWSRRTAAAVLLEALLVLRAPRWRAWIMFAGVWAYACWRRANADPAPKPALLNPFSMGSDASAPYRSPEASAPSSES